MSAFKRRIGVLGGGQLGQMLGQAGIDLAAEFTFLDPAEAPSARHVGTHLRYGFADAAGAAALAAASEVVTYEFEHLDLPTVQAIAERTEVHPSPRALEIVQDRIRQKTFLAGLDVPVAPFAAVTSAAELAAAIARLGTPCLLKTARDGYDGKGQRLIRDPALAEAAWAELGRTRCVLEGFVRFDREISLVATRGRDGAVVFHPLAENVHRSGILHVTRAPAPASELVQGRAEELSRRLLTELAYVGTFTIEFFQVGADLVVNELAPRVHNSGHWTIEGAVTSQFENHVRALMGAPLGDPAARGFAAMVNIVGTWPDRAALLRVPGLHLHDYGKAERVGRKLGHVTLVAKTAAELERRLAPVLALVG
jgi:5-(carboxyamino)imidazole ribonucleotide synthase